MNKYKIYLSLKIISFYNKLRILKYQMLSTQRIVGDVRYIQAVQTMGPGRITTDPGVKLGYFPSPHYFSTYCYLESRSVDSLIHIGAKTHINNGFVAIAEKKYIKIGCNCLIGPRVEIYDSDFHALSYKDRQNGVHHNADGVVIGDNVFIGANVRIMKGVSIGDGAVIANGSIVTKDIPQNCIAAGVPARVISELEI